LLFENKSAKKEIPPSGVRGLCIVSGGSRGIGRAIVEKFASEGLDVAVSARNQENLLQLQHFIESNYPAKCHIFSADLSIKSEVEGFVEFIKNLHQPIEVLINNVGQFVGDSIVDSSDGILEKQIETNLYSAFYLTKGLSDEMIEAKQGHIFNICSVASLEAYPNGSVYSISKFAMLGFSKSLIEEMKPHEVKVTSIIPGAVRTDSWGDVDNQDFIETKDVAGAIWEAYYFSKKSPIEEVIIRPTVTSFK
jgi:short-subunit dehydrogenase